MPTPFLSPLHPAFQVVAGRHWAMAWAVADGLVGYQAVIELDTYPSSSILTSGRIFLSLSHQIQLAALPNNHYLHKYQYFLLRTFHSTKKKPEKYVVLFLNALACMYVCMHSHSQIYSRNYSSFKVPTKAFLDSPQKNALSMSLPQILLLIEELFSLYLVCVSLCWNVKQKQIFYYLY